MPMAKRKTKTAAPLKRPYIKKSDAPSGSLDNALCIPQAILNHYACKATTPLHVAKALNVDPKGSQVRVLPGASIAFGLIEGGAQAAAITVTGLARRILRRRKKVRIYQRGAKPCCARGCSASSSGSTTEVHSQVMTLRRTFWPQGQVLFRHIHLSTVRPCPVPCVSYFPAPFIT